MSQRHPTRTALLLATASVSGILGQLVFPREWSVPSLAVMLAPAGYALAARLRLMLRSRYIEARPVVADRAPATVASDCRAACDAQPPDARRALHATRTDR